MRHTPLTAAIAALLVSPLPVLAAPAAEEAASASTLEEVIVTAQRREEKLQEVPVAVTAFSAKAIEDAGIRSTADFIALTPNVSFDQSFTVGNSFVTIRGVEQINNADSPVAIVVDGVPQGNQKQFRMQLFDVERIEVLKGPQGALYGRNAIGGAINIITRAPTNEFEGWLRVGTGSGAAKNGTLVLSGPLVDDRLLFRVSADYRSSDGLITNPYLDEKVDFYKGKDFRGRLTWHASDSVDVDLRYSYSDDKGGSTYDVAIPPTTVDPSNVQDMPPIADILGHSQRRTDDAAFKLDWQVGGGTFTWITGYTDLREKYYGSLGFCNPVDCPGGLFGFLGSVDQAQNLDVKLLSQEARFASAADQPVRWIAGGYYLDTKRDLLTSAHLIDLGNFEFVHNDEHNDNTAYAGFGQLDWDILDRTTLGVSLRYDKDQREQTDKGTGTKRKISFDAWQPKATLSYKFTDAQLGYLTYSQGFRSGGFNGIGQLDPFKSEVLVNYEAGYKSTWLDKRVTFNVSAFLQHDRDFQFFYVDLNAGGAQVIANLSRVEMQGLEADLQAMVAPGWQVYAALGLLDSKIKEYDQSLTVPAEIDNKTPKTVPVKFNLGTQYDWSVGAGLRMGVRVDYEHRGKKYWHTDNVDVMDPVDLLSARLSLSGEQWELAVSGRNLLDKYYFEDFNSIPFTGLDKYIGWPTQPRSWSAEFRYNF